MLGLLFGLIVLILLATGNVLATEPVEIGIGYLRQVAIKPALSLVEQPTEDNGVAGARLAIEDNNTTGKFLNQHFTLLQFRPADPEEAAKAALALADRNVGFIIADLSADALLRAADAVRGRGIMILNAG